MDIKQRITVMTDGKDDVQRGMTKLRAAGYDVAFLECIMHDVQRQTVELQIAQADDAMQNTIRLAGLRRDARNWSAAE